MAILSEDLGDSLLAVLQYFVPGTIILFPFMVNDLTLISSIPWQLLLLILFTIGYFSCTLRNSEIFRPQKLGTVNASADYLKKIINVEWSEMFVDSVRIHYSLKNKEYKPMVDSIKRESFFNVSYGLLGYALTTGSLVFAGFIFKGILTQNLYSIIINGFGVVMYWVLISITWRAFTKARDYVELRRILMIEQCRKDIEKDKKKIEALYENLKKFDLLKEDGIREH